MALAGWMTIQGRMGPGDLTAVIMYMLNIYAPLNFLGMAYREIHERTGVSVTTIGRVARFLAQGNGGYRLAADRTLPPPGDAQ